MQQICLERQECLDCRECLECLFECLKSREQKERERKEGSSQNNEEAAQAKLLTCKMHIYALYVYILVNRIV